MDLNTVAVFHAVVNAQSFTRAAQALGLPKSSVSRRITELEAELGVRLLTRTTRTLNLTDAGRRFHERIAQNLEAITEAATEARDERAATRGLIRVTTTSDFGSSVMPCVVGEFASKYPDVSVHVELSNRRSDLVADGIDLAIRFGKLSDSSLVARKVGAIEHRLVASPGYLAKHGEPKRLAQLSKHEALLFRPTQVNRWQLTGPSGAESVDVSGRFGGDDFAYLVALAERGHGIALVPWFLCDALVNAKRLVQVLPKYSLVSSECHVVYPAARYQPERVRLFVDFLLNALRNVAWRPGREGYPLPPERL